MPAVPIPEMFERHGVMFNNVTPVPDPIEEALRHLDAAIRVETEWAGQYTRIRAAQTLLQDALYRKQFLRGND